MLKQNNTVPFAATSSPAALYFGKVIHARMRPKAHRFNYDICTLVIDLDRIDEANRQSSLLSVNRPNLVSFNEKDHGKRDGSSLRKFVDELVQAHDLERPDRVLLWCTPRILGYTFNPLSIYFCYDKSGEPTALLYQVHNTFGQSHVYVAKVDRNATTASIRQQTDKRFYVSPFLDMDLRYDFRVNPPTESLKVHILEHDPTGPILAASFSGDHKPLTNKTLSLGILQTLGLGWKVTFAIHFEALKLWIKGIRLYERPPPPEAASMASVSSSIRDGLTGGRDENAKQEEGAR